MFIMYPKLEKDTQPGQTKGHASLVAAQGTNV